MDVIVNFLGSIGSSIMSFPQWIQEHPQVLIGIIAIVCGYYLFFADDKSVN